MDDKFALLGNFSDREADIVESVLFQLDIPVLRKYPDSGGYMEIYTGVSPTGVSLYVPEAELEKALELIKDNQEQPDYTEQNNKEQEPEEEIETKGDSPSFLGIMRFIARVCIIAFFLYHIVVFLLQLF